MALSPWTIEMLRRGISDVAKKASEPQVLSKIKSQATEILQELPDTAARGIDAVMRSAEAGKKSVERWSRKHSTLAIPMFNASGTLATEFGCGVGAPELVTEVGREFASGDVMVGGALEERLSRRIAKLLPAGGDYSLAVTHNFPAALAAFSVLVQETQLVIHRNHAVRLPNGQALPEAFGTLVPVVKEVGAVGHVAQSDFDGLENFCVILADGGQKPIEMLQLGQRDFLQAAILPVGTVSSFGEGDIPSAQSLLTQGADFVILAGDTIAGGPECGLIIGRRSGIEVIRKSAAWPAFVAGDAATAMLAVALEGGGGQAPASPIAALIETSEENLRDRAERMATRLSGSDSVASCKVTADQARLTPDGRWVFPSRQIRLRHANLSATDWADRLRGEIPCVLAVSDGDDLKIDLRWIAAASDNKLCEALLFGQA